jgi:hypothetical protein
MEEMFTRGWEQLLSRESGTLHFRVVAQPLVATFFAVRSGLRDARAGRPVFFWTLALDAPQRRALFRQLWKDVGKLFVVAFVLDAIYQVIVLHWFYPVQSLIVAVVLAIIPYLVVRGLTNRIGRRAGLAKPLGENREISE